MSNKPQRLKVWEADCTWPDDELVVKASDYDALKVRHDKLLSLMREAQASWGEHLPPSNSLAMNVMIRVGAELQRHS
jgi:hypothetical protein